MFDKIKDWVSQHPYEAGGIIVVGGLILLWLFGFFSSSSTAAPADNSAADYYNAEEEAAQQQAALSASQGNNQTEEAIGAQQEDVANTAAGDQLQAITAYLATQNNAITAAQDIALAGQQTSLAGLENTNSAAVSGAQIAAASTNYQATLAALEAENNSQNSDYLALLQDNFSLASQTPGSTAFISPTSSLPSPVAFPTIQSFQPRPANTNTPSGVSGNAGLMNSVGGVTT